MFGGVTVAEVLSVLGSAMTAIQGDIVGGLRADEAAGRAVEERERIMRARSDG